MKEASWDSYVENYTIVELFNNNYLQMNFKKELSQDLCNKTKAL